MGCGFNKCAFEEETVELQDGSIKQLKNVNIGNWIKAYNTTTKKDHFVEVLNIFYNEKDLVEVSLDYKYDRTIKTSIDHYFLCEYEDKIKMMSLKDIFTAFLNWGSPRLFVDGNFQDIFSIQEVGEGKTIDLEVNHEDHNFYCNGIVISNSHSISYATLSAITTYLKFKYPQQFFLALLKLAKYEPDIHDEINKISKELIHFGIELLRPDLAKSDLDFSLEGKDIRFGLNAIKGVSEKTLENLKNFRETDKPNKYDIFLTAKQAGINIGLLSTLIQAGTLSSCKTRRSRMVLEAQTFNILTEKEKKVIYQFGEKYDYDVLKAVNDLVFVQNYKPEKGGLLMTERRKGTFSKKYAGYKAIYEQNRNKEDFANWYFESQLLGYNPTISIKDVFKDESHGLLNLLEISSLESNEFLKFVGLVDDVRKGKTKKTGNTYYKITVKDECGKVDCLFMDAGKHARLTKYLEAGQKIPEKNNVVIMSGRKGDDCVWVENIKIEDQHIFMKLSDVK